MSQHRLLHSFPKMHIYEGIYQANKHSPIHIDRTHRISILIQGQLREQACGREVFAHPGSLVLKPGDLRHANTFGPTDTRILSVLFEEELLAGLADCGFTGWHWFHGLPTAAAAFDLARQLDEVETEAELYELIIELLAALPLDEPTEESEPPTWLHQIKERIREEYQQPLQTSALAEEVGLHPVYLARTFRRHYRCSVKDFLHRRRVEQAIRDLCAGQKALSHIAFDAGFADQSHMSREFKKQIGMSPGAFRKWAVLAD